MKAPMLDVNASSLRNIATVNRQLEGREVGGGGQEINVALQLLNGMFYQMW